MKRYSRFMYPRRSLASLIATLLVIGLAGATSVGTASVARADTVVTVVAGSGEVGYSGDGGAATAATLSGPNAITVSPSDTISVLDNGNYAVRQFAVGGNIGTTTGGTRDCEIVSPNAAMAGPCSPGSGIATDPDGNTYTGETEGVLKWNSASGLHHFISHYYGRDGYDGDTQFTSFVYPTQVRFSIATNEFYFGEPTAIRKLKNTGDIVTFVGARDNGGVVCTQPVDGSVALGSCLGIAGFVVVGTDIYLADNGHSNAGTVNPPTVWRVDSAGVLHLIATNLPALGRMAVAPDGGVYVVSGARVLKVVGGTTSVYADLSSSLSGAPGAVISDLASDSHGNLFAVSAGANRVYEIVQAAPSLPVVTGISVDSPSALDPMLTRMVTLRSSSSVGVAGYDLGWAPKGTASAQPTVGVQRVGSGRARLSFRVTAPNSDWLLFGRVVMANGTVGSWSAATAVRTPKAPELIVIGDSVSAGHHKDSATAKTTCRDNKYGYAYEFSKKWVANLPSQWRVAGQYSNLAWSGFATQKRKGSNIRGSVVDGGMDACGKNAGYIPLNEAKKLLATNAKSWNRVVVTAGISDTNWGAVLTKVLVAELSHNAAHKINPRVSFDITQKDCSTMVNGAWDVFHADVKASIINGVKKIASGLIGADPSAAVTWVGYYNMSGTGTNAARPQPYMPTTCNKPVQDAIRRLNDTIRAGLPNGITYVPMSAIMDSRKSDVQPLYLTATGLNTLFGSSNPPGWPYPNQEGAKAIAGAISAG
jgi:hypothetical protein